MAKYIVRNKQNIYDIALHLYGSIEGVFDLMISNPQLSMNTELSQGMELEYHDTFVINPDIVSGFYDEKIIPVNGERNVYYKAVDAKQRAVIKVPEDLSHVTFSISGEGKLFVDWGDNSDIETIDLSPDMREIEHYFDNNVDSRRIRWYGDFTVIQLDTSYLEGELLLTSPMVVDEFISKSNDNSLMGLFLFEGTYKVDLSKMLITDLHPIYDMSLSELNLRGVLFSSIDVLDDYLVNLLNNYQDRRACEVFLDTEPSERGMSAIQAIISDPEKNYPVKWVFHINDLTYTLED